jgi:hypothetical protein
MVNPTVQTLNGRGCGFRDAGATYVCCGLSPDGKPIEDFVVDPVIPWPGEFKRGVQILKRADGNCNDLVIFVGKEFYPSAWDYVEETRRFGASRKVPNNLDFGKFTPGESKMVFVHSYALAQDVTLESAREVPLPGCKYSVDACSNGSGWHMQKGKIEYLDEDVETPCTFALQDWRVMFKGAERSANGKTFTVSMPSFSYQGVTPVSFPSAPWGLATDGLWGIGIFLQLPLSHIEYKDISNAQSELSAKSAGFETVVLDY